MPDWNIDPELASIVPLLPESRYADPVAARAALADLIAQFGIVPDVTGLDVEDRLVPGVADAPDVAVRVYRPSDRPVPLPALLYLHGGGFTLGSIETEHLDAIALTRTLGVVVVSVEYRLAPENPFPAGLDDCFAALAWLAAESTNLGVDPARIAVYGQSAGGGLAAGLCLMARDRGGPPICFQFLGIPELDDRLETPSMQAFVDTPLWNRPNAELSWRHYLGEHKHCGADDDSVSHYAAPARATDLSGLPPAYVTTMEFDPLRDEGILYALHLLQAGVPVELHQFPGTFHGSSIIPSAAVSKRMYAERLVVLRRALQLDVPRP
jgi:acetyl esterase/lipase